MQLVIQVISSRGGSLRNRIAGDDKLADFDLMIVKQKQPGRSPGWMKVRSTLGDRHGAINIEWLASSRMLHCRVITRKSGRPGQIVGDFIAYLRERFRSRIELVNVIPARRKRRTST